jgi:hypothetical protein
MAPTGIAAAMKFFGKRQIWNENKQTFELQGLGSFKEEWDLLGEDVKAQFLAGIKDETFDYPAVEATA